MLPHDLLRELKRTVDELQALNEIGRALTSTRDLPEVLRLVMGRAQDLLKASRFSLLLFDERTRELRFEVASGPGSERLAAMRLPVGEGIAGWVAREGQPVLVQDVKHDPRFAPRFAFRFFSGSPARADGDRPRLPSPGSRGRSGWAGDHEHGLGAGAKRRHEDRYHR